MSNNRFIILFSVIYLLFSGCATVKTPSGFLPGVKEVETSTYGGWMVVIHTSAKVSVTKIASGGELIAIQNDSVFLLYPETLSIIPTDFIEQATLVFHKNETGGFALWGGLGTLSTISHGGFLILSAPLWIITGITSTITEASRPNILEYPGSSWQEMNKFARFPQGIPVGLNPKNLLPKQIRWLPPALATDHIIYKDQTYKKKSPEYNSRSFYNTISFGGMFGKYEWEGGGCYSEVPYYVDQKYGVGGIAFSNTRWHGDFQKRTFGARLYAGNTVGFWQDAKVVDDETVFGINPYYHYDWRYLGLGGGVVFGSLPWEKDEEILIANYDLQFDLRLGQYDIFFVEFKYNDHFPGSYPATQIKIGIGTGLGLTNGTVLRFGGSDKTGIYLSASIPIKNNLIIEPFYGFAEVYENPGNQFSLTLHYRFNQKRNNRK